MNEMGIALRTTIKQLLCDRGITPTQARMQIACLLFAKSQHISADQIYKLINHDNNTVSQATIYNTLGLYSQNSLLNEVVISSGKVFYDTNLDHHHLYYTDGGELEDIAADQIKISGLPELPLGTTFDGVDVTIRVRKS